MESLTGHTARVVTTRKGVRWLWFGVCVNFLKLIELNIEKYGRRQKTL